MSSHIVTHEYLKETLINFSIFSKHTHSHTQGDAVEHNKRSPSDFLKAVLGRPVNVRLNTGTDYRG
jgi:hypothetical protein